ncbi:MAG: endonuclease MutS2 [Anaerolineae bacterium]|nr:endonuclease MutS2 [Anaerolineae bacterium]
MQERDLQTLEFFKILEKLASYTSFEGSRELAFSLRPSSDEKEVELKLRETAEAISLLREKANLSLAGAVEIRPFLDRAAKFQILLPQELIAIKNTILAAARLRRAIVRYSDIAPLLSAKARGMEDYTWVAREIGQAISEQGDVLDEASPELKRIRRELRETRELLFHRLHEIITSPAVAQFIQEPIITERHGRFVIPVKAQFKSRIPGLVHDISASGVTVFLEPLEVVELGNQFRELQLMEEEEIRRVLARFTRLIAEEEPYLRRTVEIMAEIDLAFAKAQYALATDSVIPKLVPWKGPVLKDSFVHPGVTLSFKKARHPLLDPRKVVPVDIYLTDDYFILVITGPNTGGKTVTLKTAGLLALMAQAGLAIPAQEGSSLSVFRGIYADIGDEQSIEQSLSTFSSHMSNIIRILNMADSRSLVILDELGAGTDPVEGAALARALLAHLRNRSITTLVATHISELKAYAYATPGVENASMEFDPETLAPTYSLKIGFPGQSNALIIASRLGLDPEIIRQARDFLPPQRLETEALLAQIQETYRRARELEEEASRALERARQWEEEARKKLEELEKERHRILEETRREAQEEIDRIRAELARLKATAEIHRSPETIREILQEIEKLEESVPPPPPPVLPGPISVGDWVWVHGLNSSGEVIALMEEEAVVLVDNWRVRVPLDRLEKRQSPSFSIPRAESVVFPRPSKVPGELNLRGMKVEEALILLDNYLDQAFLAGLEKVRLVHGKGTGALRQALWAYLAEHPLVASFYHAPPGEGGDGVTIVRFNR